MFDRDGDSTFKYFYVSGTQKVYKIDRSRHWTIWADGYSRTEDSMIERVNVRRKFIFNMSKYDTVDEAIRELMERAAYPTSTELGAYINGGLAPHLDLTALIDPIVKYTWVKHLIAFLVPFHKENRDMSAEIYPELFKGENDLGVEIVSTDYEPPAGDSLLFNFDGEGYSPPVYNEADLIWTGEDAE